jgi:hypothetical protein
MDSSLDGSFPERLQTRYQRGPIPNRKQATVFYYTICDIVTMPVRTQGGGVEPDRAKGDVGFVFECRRMGPQQARLRVPGTEH